jgi:hypothetical protein
MMNSSRHNVHRVQADGDYGGRPPRKRPPAAAGGGSNGGGGLRAGQNVVCKISHSEPGGYSVLIPKYDSNGFLPTEIKLTPGQEVLAQFVCFSNSGMLVQARFRVQGSDAP